ncbi:glutamate receptor ionotropic, kainate glr-3-like [Panulirus ornatus]|uniref:glutamate receptor ionotropic, kainate glr-3-like n=1 Tax=Panulirus ornatus TaxID=150431 RepID=UPI003A89E222
MKRTLGHISGKRFALKETQNFMGHRLQGVAVRFYPYVDFKRDRQERGTTVTLRDSVDTRLLAAFSSALNFTFEIREDPELTWGKEKDGKFNGMVGQLQREEKDFSASTAPQPHRLKVMDHARAYPSDLMTVVSQKPHRHISPPTGGDLRANIEGLLKKFRVTKENEKESEIFTLANLDNGCIRNFIVKKVDESRSQMRTSESPQPSEHEVDINNLDGSKFTTIPLKSDEVLLGWWLVFCLVIGTGFRSSLIADLTVQEKSRPPETLVDLLEKIDWKWGTESSLYKGSVVEYFIKNEDPVMKEIVYSMEQSLMTHSDATKFDDRHWCNKAP